MEEAPHLEDGADALGPAGRVKPRRPVYGASWSVDTALPTPGAGEEGHVLRALAQDGQALLRRVTAHAPVRRSRAREGRERGAGEHGGPGGHSPDRKPQPQQKVPLRLLIRPRLERWRRTGARTTENSEIAREVAMPPAASIGAGDYLAHLLEDLQLSPAPAPTPAPAPRQPLQHPGTGLQRAGRGPEPGLDQQEPTPIYRAPREAEVLLCELLGLAAAEVSPRQPQRHAPSGPATPAQQPEPSNGSELGPAAAVQLPAEPAAGEPAEAEPEEEWPPVLTAPLSPGAAAAAEAGERRPSGGAPAARPGGPPPRWRRQRAAAGVGPVAVPAAVPLPPQEPLRVAFQPESGSVFEAIAGFLQRQGGWACVPLPAKGLGPGGGLRAAAAGGPPRVHLMLGTKYAIERHVRRWRQVAGKRTPPYPFGPTTLVNYYVGSQLLTLKAQMVRVLRDCYADPTMVTPATFVIVPGRPTADERDDFRVAFVKAERQRRANVWIAKSSHGCKGQGIRLFQSVAEALEFVDASPEPYPFVVQRYLDRPFLIGGRKFDIRVWVLVTPHFDIFMYREGVCRTSSEPYSLADLDQTLAHLTNHCLQEQGPHYSEYEQGNEMWFADFQRYLDAHHRGLHFREQAVPHMKDIIRRSLLSLRGHLIGSQQRSESRLECFQVFGFDFMLDADFRVWLIEVNGSPAVANHLLPKFTADCVRLAIEPVFPSLGRAQRALPLASETAFELVHANRLTA